MRRHEILKWCEESVKSFSTRPFLNVRSSSWHHVVQLFFVVALLVQVSLNIITIDLADLLHQNGGVIAPLTITPSICSAADENVAMSATWTSAGLREGTTEFLTSAACKARCISFHVVLTVL